ncbi:MAG: SIS domain-containing protein [Clostridiales bacterium]|jgi:D-sedoheptulose 7-phosphate isomerase|nr:SIS domain-containing protein [Clostridiales bacterium]
MKGFIKKYLDELKRALDDLNTEELSKIIDILQKAHENKRRIFVMGNGGSAATANHFTCDFGKNAIRDDERRIKIISLSDNISYITAYGNDIGYEYVFIEQLKNLMESGDIVVAISASGNSPNIIKAVEYAKEKGGVVIGLTGGKGGKLKELADIGIVANINTYEQIEDIHMIITHIIVFWFKSHY